MNLQSLRHRNVASVLVATVLAGQSAAGLAAAGVDDRLARKGLVDAAAAVLGAAQPAPPKPGKSTVTKLDYTIASHFLADPLFYSEPQIGGFHTRWSVVVPLEAGAWSVATPVPMVLRVNRWRSGNVSGYGLSATIPVWAGP